VSGWDERTGREGEKVPRVIGLEEKERGGERERKGKGREEREKARLVSVKPV